MSPVSAAQRVRRLSMVARSLSMGPLTQSKLNASMGWLGGAAGPAQGQRQAARSVLRDYAKLGCLGLGFGYSIGVDEPPIEMPREGLEAQAQARALV
mmetsp:Transcript_16268/g.28831  ORF Transcript_16268/g.28831 Transcript_16268/m.28831 type:complete len:97 (+) Transcript_16268:254-544(+)|eukprot:CAMPEP_0184514410 /NCGR_PEP_ID=MMETSP0198_2-20121128/3949_1 /TAXON_ID=1112570 /ORGANISM="Thraustochytrium sp., Strain LLF1b" /LENGTH=96 /DNA_ID=CAMNT_0026904599 /DNA_START=379 /DNA_END=669 /DNA_ORIENTATION=+